MALNRQIKFFLHPLKFRNISNLFLQGVCLHPHRDFSKEFTVLLQDKRMLQDYHFMKKSDFTFIHLCNKISFSSCSENNLEKKLSHLQEMEQSNLIEVYKLPLNVANKLVKSDGLCEAFKSMATCLDNKSLVYTFLLNNVQHRLNTEKLSFKACGVSSIQIAEIIQLLHSKNISMESADDILEMLLNGDQRSAKEIIKCYNWFYIWEEQELEKLCKKVLKTHGTEAKKYKKSQKKNRQRHFMSILLIGVSELANHRASLAQAEEIFKKLIQCNEKKNLKLK